MALGRFRYGIGPFDGLLDEKTRRALREYQAYNALSPTGKYKQKVWKKEKDGGHLSGDQPHRAEARPRKEAPP